MAGEKKDDWWLGATEPQRLVDRRWRKTRPGDLHPRRRQADRSSAETAASETTQAEHFDPDALFNDAPTSEPQRPVLDSGPVEPWAGLGLTSDATWNEVVARHRELAKRHHPDRAGSDPAATSAAAVRMASINAAFAELGKIYRLSGDR